MTFKWRERDLPGESLLSAVTPWNAKDIIKQVVIMAPRESGIAAPTSVMAEAATMQLILCLQASPENRVEHMF